VSRGGIPAPGLLALVAQIDRAWPARKRDADGIMGDAAHQARRSDHNEGNALDVTRDTDNGPELHALAEALFVDPRTHYVILDRQIRTRGIQGDAWHAYTGPDPHTGHLHLSIWPERRDDVRLWDLHATDAGEPNDQDQGPAGSAPREGLDGRQLAAGLAVVGVGLAALGLIAWAAGRESADPAW
jgi:hypothetical protein